MHALAHVLPNNVVPAPVQWAAIAMIGTGGFGVLRRRRKLVDAVSWITFSIGATGCIVMVGIAMLGPPPPGYALSLAVHEPVTTPVPVSVCARKPDGSQATAPDGDRVLGVFVDGVQVLTGAANKFAVAMTPGEHALRVELLTRDHREFNPAVAATATVDVTGKAGLSGPGACPNN